ncbi:MAG: HEAT repeat domain-containing protein [Verrucomicrobia bacterium]|nr:HEAT repeat domain-containing protein [Verrucomicrobiota bacterium]
MKKRPPNAVYSLMKKFLSLLTLALGIHAATGAENLTLNKGDHICIIGNTLADRMQHFGWLETLLQARFPKHELVIRNLGFSGDELITRLRSMDFGKPDEWLSGISPHPNAKKHDSALFDKSNLSGTNRFELSNTKADVIFAFFGYNESYAGPAGLDKFKKDLDATLKHMLAQKYNGKSAPRIVLFSPLGHEFLKSPDLPDGSENNARLKLYTAAMAEIAKSNGVLFVDLFTPTLDLYAKTAQPLTINGVHLNERGDRQVALTIERALFGSNIATALDSFEKLRQAVLDKNLYWFNHYRATDGYSTFGDRAFLTFEKGSPRSVNKTDPDRRLPSNYEVLQRELLMLDVMTSNRDKRIWAVAQGQDLKVDDSNLPAPVKTESNKPGPLPGGKHEFNSAQDAIKRMTAGKNMKVTLFASEEQFPDLAKPVQMAFDTEGRLWVAVWPSYPHWNPSEPLNDKLLILEDTDGDGKADKQTVFADKLHNPTGFEFWGGGVILAQVPDIMFLKDTNGDDTADVRDRILHGMDSADTHHSANSFVLDPGGALYWQEGTFHQTQVESPWGPPVRCSNAGVFRFEPRTFKFDAYVSYGFANPHGHVFDRWGQDFVTDGTGAQTYWAAAFSGHVDYPRKHPGMQTVYKQRTRPCPGTEILSSRHFPDEMQGNLLVPNVIGFLGILQYKFQDKGSGFGATEVEPIVSSDDPNFRPSDVEVGPDGAIWFLDWQNPIIGHMQHNLRDPSRDHSHGRIYRVTYEGRPLNKPEKITGEPIDKLLGLLKEPEDRVRYRTRIELSGRKPGDVIAALSKWVATLDAKDKDYEHHMLEALWLHQNMNVVNQDLLKRMLRSPEPRARAAATRVLCYWRDRVLDPLGLLKVQVNDDNPRVRLEAVRACSFFKTPQAADVALESLNKEQDYYLKYTLDEAMNTLDKVLKQPNL